MDHPSNPMKQPLASIDIKKRVRTHGLMHLRDMIDEGDECNNKKMYSTYWTCEWMPNSYFQTHSQGSKTYNNNEVKAKENKKIKKNLSTQWMGG